MSFLALFVTLPTQQSAGRMRVWRALRALGSATLRDGVYLLPDSPAHAQALGSIAEDVKSVEGTAAIYCLDGRDEAQGQTLMALFDRQGDYAGLLKAIQAANPAAAKAVRALQREFSALAAIDFFPGEAQRQAEEALVALQARASGEPLDGAGRIRRLAGADFQGRTWATRHHPWVDRLASAWLIQRHIDPRARFVWLADPRLCPPGALGFDFDGAAFTHVEGRVTFEVLAASFGLADDPALGRIAAIVHFLDVGGVPVAEAAGIEAVLAGARATAANDDQLLSEACRLFDNLVTHYQQEHARDE
ncbi:MAG: chromate resistance protein ChrB domain-containing protein [Chromatiaceae bacterium]